MPMLLARQLRSAGVPTMVRRTVTLRDAKSMTLRPKSANLMEKPNGFRLKEIRWAGEPWS